ncbi:DUF6292 family protein [Saccharopolyspora hattusasensis]|uniref:DUF6292 family protein n=1 Tax=Saccharopolyspora hattusasensis TaxID=1128679 RepID=UPI003D989AC1
MDTTSRAADGLVTYVRSVADDLGGDVFEIDINLDRELATAIVLVNSHVPTLAEFPLLLTWDEVSGWGLRIETDGQGDTAVLEFMGEDILPDPARVEQFLLEATNGQNPGMVAAPAFRFPNAQDDLERRLAEFCE